MASATIDAAASDGYIRSFATTYADARAGTGTKSTANALGVGQQFFSPTYDCYEAFLDFDTSAIPDGATVESVALKLYLTAGGDQAISSEFTVEARSEDWGATLTTADFVAGASLSSKTLLASLGTASMTESAYNSLTENGTNFRSAINLTGNTRLVLCSSRQTGNNTPTGTERVFFEVVGGAHPPQIVVTYSVTVTGNGALATITAAGKNGTAAVEIDAAGALATVDLAGKDGTASLASAGTLATINIGSNPGAISSGAEGQGQAAAITVLGYGGTVALTALGAAATVTVGGLAGAATFVVSAAGALATVAVQSFAGLAIRAGGSGRYRPGAGRYVSARSPSGTFQSMKSGVGRFFGPRGGMGR